MPLADSIKFLYSFATSLRSRPKRVAGGLAILLLGTGVTAFGVAPLAPDASDLPVVQVVESVQALPLQTQIDALIPLVRDIVKRHQIKPERILGHGEVTPSYKEDPGPTFPWKLLADLGITPPWPDVVRMATQRALYETSLPEVLWFQQTLSQHGYEIERTGVMDKQTQRVLMNFQMRYRPSQYEGLPDAESAALLWVLTNPVAPAPPAP